MPAAPAAPPVPPAAAGARRSRPPVSIRLGWGTVVLGAFEVTLLRPASWAFGLLGFLAGGGLLLMAWPILVLPTPTGLQNALGGPVSSLVFGAPTSGLLVLIVMGLLVAVGAVVAATLVGAWAERQGIAIVLEAAADAELGLPATAADLAGAPGPGRVAVIRLLALAPVAFAAALGWKPLYDATYHELILPGNLVTPLPLRVLGEIPLLVLAIAATWVVADAAAAVGVRRLVIDRHPVLVAWLLGWTGVIRRPQRVIPSALLGVGLLVLVVGPSTLIAAIGWDRVRELLVGGREPLLTMAAIVVWVATWLGGLVLAGVTAAVRAAVWTLEMPMRLPPPAPEPDPASPSPR